MTKQSEGKGLTAQDDIRLPVEIRKPKEFIEFCKWSAQPKSVREPSTQEEWAVANNIDRTTLPIWKQTAEFDFNRRKMIREWLGDDFPEVMNTVKKNAIRGNAKHIEIMLRWLGELSNDVLVDNSTKVVNQYVFEIPQGSTIEKENEEGFKIFYKNNRQRAKELIDEIEQ